MTRPGTASSRRLPPVTTRKPDGEDEGLRSGAESAMHWVNVTISLLVAVAALITAVSGLIVVIR